jgi:arylsulfate sulfotransferase
VLASKRRQTWCARALGAVPSGPTHLARRTRRLPGFFAVTLGIVFCCSCSSVSNTARMVEASFGSVSVALTPSITGSAPVGTTVVWTASAQDSEDANATFTYQFSVGRSGQSLQVRRDFYHFNTFPWTPAYSEGTYDVKVVARSSSGATAEAIESFSVTSRVSGSSPAVSQTSHPLVALYSLPPCPAGQAARVRFKQPSDTFWQATSFKGCNGTTSLNFYVAGMRAATTYLLQHDVYNGPFDSVGPVLSFTTGAVPSDSGVPAYSVKKASAAPNNTAEPVLLSIGAAPYATDASGQLIWYLPPTDLPIRSLTRPVKGGTFLLTVADTGNAYGAQLLREYDLAGNLVRETNFAAISQQLTARGADPITSIHHEALRLPDGSTAIIASVEKVADQGAGRVDVLGDMAVVLDSNLQVKFSWNEFDHLNIGRPAILGETCKPDNPGCPPVTNPKYSVANDWTHSNSLWLAPDGNLIISIRHQDWVIKFRYQSGNGDGTILWRLGKDGDFEISAPPSNPYPWFSHQHDVEYASNGLLTLFDNGNTRVAMLGGNSRGQGLHLDEANKTATLEVNLDLGDYSSAVGTAQLLSNGNYFFDLGFLTPQSKLREFSPSSALEAEFEQPGIVYRAFRMRSLYSKD